MSILFLTFCRFFCRQRSIRFASRLRGSEFRVQAVLTHDGQRFDCDMMVNAAGAWSRKIAEMLGIDLPVYARRRSIFNFKSPARLARCPLVIDPSGVYWRPEGETYICGVSPGKDRDFDDLPLSEVDHELFDDVIWPALAARVPEFEALNLALG